jgi:flagellar basal body-associated protein FliL
MANTTLQKKDDSMKGVIFIILSAVLVMCLALATGLLRP